VAGAYHDTATSAWKGNTVRIGFCINFGTPSQHGICKITFAIFVPCNCGGHNDLASTMVYLKAMRSKDVTARIDASELAAFALGPVTAVQAAS
jgi:hypothetical protein